MTDSFIFHGTKKEALAIANAPSYLFTQHHIDKVVYLSNAHRYLE